MATKLGDLTVGADGSWSSGPHTMTSGAKSVTLRRKSDGSVLVTRSFTVAAAGGISLVGTPVAGSGAGSAITLPSGRASGDIIVLVRDTDGAPTGYTQKVNSAGRFSVCWRSATNTSADNVTVGLGNAYSCAIYRGCVASGDPFEASSAAASGDSAAGAITLASITTLTANAWVLAAAIGSDSGWDDQEGGAGPNTGPTWAVTGPATTLDAGGSSLVGNSTTGAALYHSLKAATGATGTGTVRFYMTGYAPFSQGTETFGALLALKPA